MSKTGWNLENSYAALDETLYSRVMPRQVPAPSVVVFNDELSAQLGLDLSGTGTSTGEVFFSGNKLPEGSVPIAQAYAGHQFGHFTMLGDGRAILLGEQVTPDNGNFDIQLKGCGRTPYSRNGDGKATLSAMLREYLVSEAMHHLGIPTTRSLAVVKTGEGVLREVVHQGAVLTRVAASHIRVGTFEYARYFVPEQLDSLLNYALRRHYPELLASKNRAVEFLRQVMQRQIDLVADWMRVGFIHGVMNTDNMSIAGETIDYGPCAFINSYHPGKVFSSIDHYGRYSFGNQPEIARWNLGRLAVALMPLINGEPEKSKAIAEEVLAEFDDLFRAKWLTIIGKKIGIEKASQKDEQLISELFTRMQANGADYTNTFLELENELMNQSGSVLQVNDGASKAWLKKWKERISQNQGGLEKALQLMQKANPAVIPRNHLLEEALEAANMKNDISRFQALMNVLCDPYYRPAKPSAYHLPPESGDEGYHTFCGT